MKTTLSKPRGVKSLATVSAALAATAASSQAATVQITLTGNQLSRYFDTLNADLTGDGTNDINIGSGQRGSAVASVNINSNPVSARFAIQTNYNSTDNGGSTRTTGPKFNVVAKFASGGVGVSHQSGGVANNIKYLNAIYFSDARINGGVSTQGYLEVNAFNSSSTSQTVALTRLVFDNASTTLGTSGLSTSATYSEFVPAAVPEPSSFGLLALGAGGLLARRRRQAA